MSQLEHANNKRVGITISDNSSINISHGNFKASSNYWLQEWYTCTGEIHHWY